MKAVLQRVKRSRVSVEGKIVAEIALGLLVLLAVAKEDTQRDIDYIVEKIVNLRIFDDWQGKINFSVKDISGEILVVSQFTLLANCQKGRRPSFDKAASPEQAEPLYEQFIRELQKRQVKVKQGKFQAVMDVELTNCGPVTVIIESQGEK